MNRHGRDEKTYKLLVVLIKVVSCLFVLGIALLPFWIFLLASRLLSPEGFWQQLAFLGIGLWFLAPLQVVLLGLGIYTIIAIILEEG